MLSLIESDDSEIAAFFRAHCLSSHSESQLLSQVESKTEETYLSLLEKHLSNEEYNLVRSKRSMKDQGYGDVFRKWVNYGPVNVQMLVVSLKGFAASEVKKIEKE